ncbi:MAG: hypothetical protein ABW034_13805 [Steroidobacteraceae bacterium]
MKLQSVAWIVCVALGGCSTLRAYDDPELKRDEVAVVAGDYRFNAGSPLTLILRAVDGQPLDARYHAVELAPGEHVFVVDCRLRETQTTSRHEVSASVAPGVRYGFTAEVAPGMRGCDSVQLQSRN